MTTTFEHGPSREVRAVGYEHPIRTVPDFGPIPQGAVVEIVEPGSGTTTVIPKSVKVNGTDVGLIAENGVTVHPGMGKDTATVTLTLLPRRIVIGYEDGDGKAVQS